MPHSRDIVLQNANSRQTKKPPVAKAMGDRFLFSFPKDNVCHSRNFCRTSTIPKCFDNVLLRQKRMNRFAHFSRAATMDHFDHILPSHEGRMQKNIEVVNSGVGIETMQVDAWRVSRKFRAKNF